MMARKTLPWLLLVLASGCTCNEIKEKLLPAFNVDIPEINVTVPPLPKVLPTAIPIGALRTAINMDSAIRANTNGVFGAGAVHFVKVKKVTIRATNADKNNNLSNFESARISIFNDTSSVDIADFRFPPTYTDNITVTNTNSRDISCFLRGRELAYNVHWKNRKVTKKFLKLKVLLSVTVQ